jgi:hypothetical protein
MCISAKITACCVPFWIAAVMMLLASAAYADLDLLDGGWSGPAKLSADASGAKVLQWNYAFVDPDRGEELFIEHALPSDMTQYGGFIARVNLDSPQDTVFKVRFYEADGDTWEWAWWPGAAKPGWNEFRIADFLTGGAGPWTWEPGDHKRDYRAIKKVKLFLTDEPSRRKVGTGTVLVSDFRFISLDEAKALAGTLAEENAKALERMVDLKEICSLESTDWWCGPRPEDLSVSSDCVEGRGSLQVNLDVMPGEHFRLERNFIRGGDLVEKDLTGTKSISFAWKLAMQGCSGGCLRLWDRAGGWLEWPVAFGDSAGKWNTVTLAVPGDCVRLINLKRIGGIVWEVRAGGSALTGKLLLDDLKFSDRFGPGIQPINKKIVAAVGSGKISAIPIAHPIPAPAVHIVVNLTPVSYALQDGNSEAAITGIKSAISRYAGVPGLEFAFGPEISEAYTKLGAAKFTDTLVTVAKWCEANGAKFYIQVAGPGGIATPYDAAKATIDAAPKCCLGIWMGETPIEEYAGGIDKLVAMLDLVRERGKRLCYHRFTQTWWNFAIDKNNLDRVFAPRFADTIVPLWENLEPSCEGLTLGSVLGFWVSGRAKQWGVSTQSWWWDNMRLGGTNDMPAHNWMRMFVSTIGLGATYVQIEPEWSMTGDCMKALQRFGELLKAGAIVPSPGPDETVSIPKLALQVKPTDRTGTHGFLSAAQWNYCDRSRQLPKRDLFRSIYRSPHVYEQLMPETPWGLVAILPQGRAPKGLGLVTIDGLRVFDKGEWLPETESLPHILAAYKKAAKAMPLAAEGCFFTATRLAEGDYLAYLIDAEERFPADVKTSLDVRVKQPWKAYDAITGEELQPRGSSVPVTIPAGGFRLVRVVGQ